MNSVTLMKSCTAVKSLVSIWYQSIAQSIVKFYILLLQVNYSPVRTYRTLLTEGLATRYPYNPLFLRHCKRKKIIRYHKNVREEDRVTISSCYTKTRKELLWNYSDHERLCDDIAKDAKRWKQCHLYMAKKMSMGVCR